MSTLVLSSGKVFASQERVSGFPEKGLTSGEVRETSGEVRGTSGEVWETSGNPWIAVKFRRERTSGEVTEKLPRKFGELPGKSGDFPEARGSLTPSQRLAKFVSNECPILHGLERELLTADPSLRCPLKCAIQIMDHAALNLS